MRIHSIFLWLFLLLFMSGCTRNQHLFVSLPFETNRFQTTVDGKSVNLYLLRNDSGMTVAITNYGARVVSLYVPDKRGKFEDVVQGFDSIGTYLRIPQNFGSTVGRYLGKINNGRFVLDGKTYQLASSRDGHCMHGGPKSFAYKVWDVKSHTDNELVLHHLSPDGENGFPGNLSVELTYRVTDENGLDIRYKISTDKATPVNIGHHSFFNINGDMRQNIDNELLYVAANDYIPYDSTKCVYGAILPVKGTPFDFRMPHCVGDSLQHNDDQLKLGGGGYDHTFLLDPQRDRNESDVWLNDKESGRVLEVYTNEPCVHVYTANGHKGKIIGKNGIAYQRRTAICFETGKPHDAPNQAAYPNSIVRPGKPYISHTLYKFSVLKGF